MSCSGKNILLTQLKKIRRIEVTYNLDPQELLGTHKLTFRDLGEVGKSPREGGGKKKKRKVYLRSESLHIKGGVLKKISIQGFMEALLIILLILLKPPPFTLTKPLEN